MSTPKLRFNGFNEDWSDYTINDITESLKSGLSRLLHHQDIGMPVIRANNIDNGQLTYNDLKYWYINDPQGADTKNYIVHKNDILINFINSEAKMGTTAIILEEPFREMIYTTNILKMNTNELADNYFFYCYTGTKKYKDYIKLITKPAVNQASFTTVDFKKHSIKIPTVTEQTKISSFFKLINKKIQLQQEKIDLLKEQKKGFMQKVFSQELRFKDEDGQAFPDWEEKYLSSLIKVNSGRDYKHLGTGKIPVYGTGGYMLSVDQSLSEIDSIGIGRKGTIDVPQILKAPFWTVDTLFYCTPLEDNNLQFVHTLFENINWKSFDESTGVPSLSKKTIENIIIQLPNTQEQKKIGTFFERLNTKIDYQVQKLQEMKIQKQAFMQQMFI